MSRRRPFSARPKKGRDALEGGELGREAEVEPKRMKGSELVPPEASEGEKEWRRAWGAGGRRRVLDAVTGGGRGWYS